jgi:hypothetical protein
MKRTIIFSALIGIFVFAGISMGQQPPTVPAYRMVIDPRPASGEAIVQVRVPAIPDRPLLLFEAVLPASSEAACLASRDFSTAYPASPDRASLVYDGTTNTYNVRWMPAREGSCRVLLVTDGDGQVNAGDYVIWRQNFGSTAGRLDGEQDKDDVLGSRTGSRSTARVGDRFTTTVVEPVYGGRRMNFRRNK